MWNDEDDFANWKNSDVTSDYETIATVDNGAYRVEYEYGGGKITVIESELDVDGNSYETVDEYINSEIITDNETLHDVLIWLLEEISGV